MERDTGEEGWQDSIDVECIPISSIWRKGNIK